VSDRFSAIGVGTTQRTADVTDVASPWTPGASISPNRGFDRMRALKHWSNALRRDRTWSPDPSTHDF